MEARDLMIGDWVEYLDKYHIITKINKIERSVGLWGKLIRDDIIVPTNTIEPIPLTPEILEKNGWICEYFGRRQEWWLDKTKFPIVRYSVNDTLLHNGIVLKFVHQLQHALRLYGIDKEIEL